MFHHSVLNRLIRNHTFVLALLLAIAVLVRVEIRAGESQAVAPRDNDGDGDGDGGGLSPSAQQTLAASLLGERIFLETRFAQYFFANCNGNYNAPLAVGDPTVATLQTLNGPIPSPFAGQSMNCRQCHLVQDAQFTPGGGTRTYADFGHRTPIPDRGDGLTMTVRNSPALVNSMLPRKNGFFLHWDAEFPSIRDLIKGTFTGRNFGWLPNEGAIALHHFATIIREDDGSGALAQANGGPFRRVFLGTDPNIPLKFRLGEAQRMDVMKATDEQILNNAATCVGVYLAGLIFSFDANGVPNGSPYDRFLLKNGLPQSRKPNETAIAYARRLRKAIEALKSPIYVTPKDGSFQLHPEPFAFGPQELEGLQTFLREPGDPSSASVGNCIACHAPPLFTDFSFHNNGAEQEEYDSVHGSGAFMALPIPTHAQRLANAHEDLEPSAADPTALGRFHSIPTIDDPLRVDLGIWNVIGNPNMPNPQRTLFKALLKPHEKKVTLEMLVDRNIAVFKTPGIRDLGQSDPYFHTGRMNTLEDVIGFYIRFSQMVRDGTVRNADPAIGDIHIDSTDVTPLTLFLISLNEDYTE